MRSRRTPQPEPSSAVSSCSHDVLAARRQTATGAAEGAAPPSSCQCRYRVDMTMPRPDADPCFRSAALADLPAPDFADVCIVAIAPAAVALPTDPAYWARAVFDPRSAPRWVQVLFAVRQLAVRLVGIPPGDTAMFDVAEVVGDEAVIRADDVHLDFRCGVGIDAQARLLRVTTAVRLKGWRGRLYFVPVSVLHGPVTRAMATNAVRRTVAAGD